MTAQPERPHRHLCPTADERDALPEVEFWPLVLAGHTGPEEDYDDLDDEPADLGPLLPCPICGAAGACAYDEDGRPLLHGIPADDD